jgi:hypothetical protein
MLETAALIWGLADAFDSSEPALGPTFAVSYHAALACPTQAQFEAAILARAPTARSAASGTDANVRFDAELSPAVGMKPRLRVSSDDGSSQDREIDADDCSEAMQSMAVIAAMILASLPPQPEHEPAPEPQPPEEPKPAVEPAQPPVAAPPPTRKVDAPTSASAHSNWLAVSGGIGLESAAAPTVMYAGSASAELGSVTPGLLAPSVRLSALFGQAADVTTTSGTARFQLVLVRVHACGLRFGGPDVNARLCAVVDGGALLARGIDARNERDQAMPWLGVGLGAIGGVRVSRRVSLELSGSARALLVRDEFIFAPGTPVHQPSIIAGDFRIGLAYQVW